MSRPTSPVSTVVRTNHAANPLAAMQAAQMARARENQHRALPGTGGGGRNAAPVEIAGKKYWKPNGLPDLKWEAGNGKPAVTPEAIWLPDETELYAILVAQPSFLHFHSLTKMADVSVLPPLERARVTKDPQKGPKSIPLRCTFNANAGPVLDDSGAPFLDDYRPHQDWREEAVDDIRILTLGNNPDYRVQLRISADGAFVIDYPRAHPWTDRSGVPGYLSSETEAMFWAEKVYAQARSCVFCAEWALAYKNRVPKDAQTIYGAKESALLPMFSLRHAFPSPGKKPEDAGYLYARNEMPEGRELAIREGWAYLRTSIEPSRQGQGHLTWLNWNRHVAGLMHTCSNCLDDHGARKGKREHAIDYTRMTCRKCGHDLIEPGIVERAEAYGEVQFDDDGVLVIDRLGIFQMLSTQFQCRHCNHVDFPEDVKTCSSCDNPTPVQAHQVVTRVSRPKASAYYTFEVATDPRTRQFFYRDWADLAFITTPQHASEVIPETVEEVVRPGLIAFEHGEFAAYMPATKSRVAPELTSADAARLIGETSFVGIAGQAR